MKILSILYLIVLSFLLTVKDPLSLLGSQPKLQSFPWDLGNIAHFVSFTLLVLVMKAARWPVSDRVLFGLLAAYGLTTEVIQAFLPWRSAEIGDFLRDVLGIAVGFALLRLFAWEVRRRKARRIT